MTQPRSTVCSRKVLDWIDAKAEELEKARVEWVEELACSRGGSRPPTPARMAVQELEALGGDDNRLVVSQVRAGDPEGTIHNRNHE